MLAQHVAGQAGVAQVVVRVMDQVDVPVFLRLPHRLPLVLQYAIHLQAEPDAGRVLDVGEVHLVHALSRGDGAQGQDLPHAAGPHLQAGLPLRAIVVYADAHELPQCVTVADEEHRRLD